VTTFNVGWLSRAHSFPTSAPAPELVEALHRCCFRAERFAMGIHNCDICGQRASHACVADRRVGIGTGEIHIEEGGVCYAAPTLIVHYVEAHSYLPPAPFISGVLATAARIALLSTEEREALGRIGVTDQRHLACEAVERMVERSPWAWARPALAAARAGRRDWDAAIPAQFEDGVLLEVLSRLSSLMNDSWIADEPEFARQDFLGIIERSRDTAP
jgi:hypothetical protein